MQSPSATTDYSGKEWMARLEKVVSDICLNQGCELYDVEFVGGSQGRTLRIFIDKAEGFIGVEDCSNVSKGLNDVLDVQEDLVPGDAYHLEVSSPGLERDLRHPRHFTKLVGQSVWLKLGSPLENFAPAGGFPEKFPFKIAKQVTGELLGLSEEALGLKVEAVDVNIPWSAIEKAKSVFEFEKKDRPSNAKPDKKKKR